MTDENREIPYIKIIHPIFDEIRKARYLTLCEKDILWCIVAYTIGFQRISHNLSISFIANDIDYSQRIVKKGLKELENRNIIINYKKPESKINKWGININISNWNREPQFPQEIKAIIRNREPQFPQEIKADKHRQKIIDSEPQFPIDSEPQFPIDSEPQFPQEIKKLNKKINKNNIYMDFEIDRNIYINFKKKIVNGDLLRKDFYKSNPGGTIEDLAIFFETLYKKGYTIK